MNAMLRKTLKSSVSTLCITLIFLFIASTCDKTEIPHEETPSPYGNWEVKAISISNELTILDSVSNDAVYSKISITIPDTTQGNISGNTFMNTIWIGYEIRENQQIIFNTYSGTRIAEEPWGMAFKDHIMFNVVKFNTSNNELQFIDSLDNPVIVFVNRLNEN